MPAVSRAWHAFSTHLQLVRAPHTISHMLMCVCACVRVRVRVRVRVYQVSKTRKLFTGTV